MRRNVYINVWKLSDGTQAMGNPQYKLSAAKRWARLPRLDGRKCIYRIHLKEKIKPEEVCYAQG